MSRKGENIYKRKDGRWEGRYKKSVANRFTAIVMGKHTEKQRISWRNVKDSCTTDRTITGKTPKSYSTVTVMTGFWQTVIS